MTETLTNLQRARIFALYLGQPIVSKAEGAVLSKQSGGYTDWSISYMHDEEADHLTSIGHGEMKPYAIGFGKNRIAIDRYHLFLTPISKISDEDKTEIEDIVGFSITKFTDSTFFAVTRTLLQDDTQYEFPLSFINDDAAQYLREKGYAMPINEKSLFELDLATDKTKWTKDGD